MPKTPEQISAQGLFSESTCAAFRELAPDTKFPLEIADTCTEIIDGVGKTVLRLPAAAFMADKVKALHFANQIVTAVNTCAGYAAQPDGTWKWAL